MLKVTLKQFKSELRKTIHFFNARENFKNELDKAVEKYGIVNLPKDVLRAIPTGIKAVYESKWYWHPFVWMRIIQIAFLNAENENIKKVLSNG